LVGKLTYLILKYNTLEILIDAMTNKQQIPFAYNKEGKTTQRVGDPYAVFIYTAKNNQ